MLMPPARQRPPALSSAAALDRRTAALGAPSPAPPMSEARTEKSFQKASMHTEVFEWGGRGGAIALFVSSSPIMPAYGLCASFLHTTLPTHYTLHTLSLSLSLDSLGPRHHPLHRQPECARCCSQCGRFCECAACDTDAHVSNERPTPASATCLSAPARSLIHSLLCSVASRSASQTPCSAIDDRCKAVALLLLSSLSFALRRSCRPVPSRHRTFLQTSLPALPVWLSLSPFAPPAFLVNSLRHCVPLPPHRCDS
ncbi:uncharacterized protein K460DRAFT_168532 [Cucurbitaria berberidis CBS 394.84]|uniref:Uncharacterized protein n=1 Tax=Cucurbitaria berberidis CBS 394.84 TaxID=1168544 RepID=A0A9P4G9F8_9PLEO|nr:uncharacterized protein K460DRAFT_168532 [Cucurbitaria berberidis CBS 394.84]KAF1841502.1 hypothetical protein K460DRAFT_168532 [Cucurbitaria berberidis CBS 394.84]